MSTAVTQLGYIGFGVKDAPAWSEFLTGTLGLMANGTAADGTDLYRMDEYRSRIQVQETGEDDLTFLGWHVADRRALSEINERLTHLGFKPEAGSRDLIASRGVIDLVRVVDPCGLVNEISYGPAIIVDQPFVGGRALAAGFVAGDQGAGHVVLKSQDPEGYVRFYEDGLGLGVSDHVGGEGGFSIAFYHANERHHSLAFPLVPLPPGGPRIQHFMVQLADFDDMGRGQDIAQKKGELLNYMGRHTNDLMISCYITSPSEIGVEYGWGAPDRPTDLGTFLHKDGGIWGHQVAGKRSIFDIVVPDGPPPGMDGSGPGGPGAPLPDGTPLAAGAQS